MEEQNPMKERRTLRDRNSNQKPKLREKGFFQVLMGASAGLLVLVLLYCGYVVFSDNLWFSKLKNSENQANEASSLSNQLNVLVMGVDKREEDVGRSDTLFLVSIDPKTHKVFQLSIPRDTRVLIPKYGWDKVNHAYALGGKDLTVATVEKFLGIKIHHTVEIDFHGFYRIVDAIGGVDIDVEKRMYYEDPWDEDGGLIIDLRPGLQHMDGRTAITYVRYRDEDGDIGRIKRQQKFMKAVIEKVSSPSIITRLPVIISEISSAVDTDLSTLELINLGRFFKESKEQGLETNMGMVPGGGYYIRGISYWIPDMETLLSGIDEFDGMEPTPKWERWAEEQIALYRDNLPSFDEEGYIEESQEEGTSSETEDKDDSNSTETKPSKKTTEESTKKSSSPTKTTSGEKGSTSSSGSVKDEPKKKPAPVGGPKSGLP